MLGALAQFERKLIAERVRAGPETAWTNGSASGRKRLDDKKHIKSLWTFERGEETLRFVFSYMRQMHVPQ